MTRREGACNQQINAIVPFQPIIPELIYYFCLSPEFQEKLHENSSATTVPIINKSKFSKLFFPLPPLTEQRRIVVKLDAATERLRAFEVILEQVPAMIERFRQSVLHHAVTGKLTEEWREEHPEVVRMTDFLKDLRQKRVQSYEEKVKEAKELGLKKPKKDYAFKFEEHENIETWASAQLDQLIYISGRIGWKGLKAEEYTEEGPLFLSVHSLNYGEEVNFEEAYHITEERYRESPEIMLQEDDILLCKDGAGIGKIGIVKNLEEEATVNSSLLVIRALEAFTPKFLFYFLSGPSLQEIVQSRITGSAIPHLFQRDIKEFILSVPPLEEQEVIVEKVEELMETAQSLEHAYEQAKRQIEQTRQSLLSRAFRGELLTPSELLETQAAPDYEQADVLLEKIKAEKAKLEKELKAARKKRRSQPKKKIVMKNLEIIEVLKTNGKPMKAVDVWKKSKYKDDIDAFYEALRKEVEIEGNVEQAVGGDQETYLSIKEMQTDAN